MKASTRLDAAREVTAAALSRSVNPGLAQWMSNAYQSQKIWAFGTVVARTLCMREVEGSNPSTSSFLVLDGLLQIPKNRRNLILPSVDSVHREPTSHIVLV